MLLTIPVALGLAVLIWPQKQTIKLPNGSVFRFEAVTTGTNYFCHGNVLEKVFERWIPYTGYRLFQTTFQKPKKFVLADYDGQYVVVWLSSSGGPAIKPNAFNDIRDQFRAVAMDHDGNRYENFYVAPFFLGPSGKMFLGLKLTAFPRDKRSFGIEIFAHQKSGGFLKAGTIVVSNPLGAVPTQWKAQHLPITNHLDELEVVLHGVEAGNQPRDPSPEWLEPKVSFKMTRTVQDRKQWWDKWWPMGCVLRDNLGNYQKLDRRDSPSGDWNFFEAACALNPKDVWKVELTLASSVQNSGPKDSVKITDVGKGQKKTVVTPSWSIPVTAEWNSEWFRVSLPSDVNEMGMQIVDLEDEKGAPIRILSGGFGRPNNWEAYFPGSRAGTITVKVVLHRLVRWEYFVKPTVVNTIGEDPPDLLK